MANSKWEYVRHYEQPDRLPLGNWIVVRIDGRGFHRFSATHHFVKPNDMRALKLMNKAAEGVLRDVQDIAMAYGYSDEYSFVLHHATNLYSRRASKLVSTIVSTFTAHFLIQWPAYFPDSRLAAPSDPSTTAAADTSASNIETVPSLELIPTGPLPTFDGRAVCYPRLKEVRDYLSWRQADCHVNNLYNTTFWALVLKGGMSNRDAEQELMGTYAPDKHEILFQRFGINYNNEAEMFRKGSMVLRELSLDTGYVDTGQAHEEGEGRGTADDGEMSKTQRIKKEKQRRKAKIVVVHEDMIGKQFWEQRPWLLVE